MRSEAQFALETKGPIHIELQKIFCACTFLSTRLFRSGAGDFGYVGIEILWADGAIFFL
jgi:hypothetical protein